MLKAKKFTNERFLSIDGSGYHLFSGDWGVIHTATNEWVTFDSKLPYRPQGGKRAALEVATECNPSDLQYIEAIN